MGPREDAYERCQSRPRHSEPSGGQEKCCSANGFIVYGEVFGHDRQPAVLLRKFITCIEMDVYGKQGRNGVLRRFQQLRSCIS